MSRHLKSFVIPVDAARRKFLISFGVAYIAIGLSYVYADASAPVSRALAFVPVSLTVWGWMWAVCGAVAFLASFLPTTRDKPGFFCLSIPPTLWAFLYATAAALHAFTNYNAPRAWVSMVIFGLIAYAVDVVSGMVDARLAARHERVAL